MRDSKIRGREPLNSKMYVKRGHYRFRRKVIPTYSQFLTYSQVASSLQNKSFAPIPPITFLKSANNLPPNREPASTPIGRVA
jgi:hypothetical protein